MSAAKSMNAYLNNLYEGMTPEKLIHMLFKGALQHLEYVKQGILEKNIKKRGEHLSKVISIISELNTSLDPKMNDESTQFLRGLYASMLTELPKVSITNDVKTIDLTTSYIEKLNEIWETTVLNKPSGGKPKTIPTNQAVPAGYNAGSGHKSKSFFV